MSLFDDLPDPQIESPPENTSPYKVETLPDVQNNIELRQSSMPVAHPMQGKTDTEFGKEFNEALLMSPALRAHWTPPDVAPAKDFSFGEALLNSIKRDSFIGNTARWMDQIANEKNRTSIDEATIWDNRDEILYGISPANHEYLLNQPTYGIALRESERIRNRERAILREMNTGFGKSMVADITGFIVDPSNLLPGYGMMKGISVARRMNALALLREASSTKGKAMVNLTIAGGFEEAIRMAPRWQADPTYEANQYVEGIVMSAAFSGLLPLAFGAAGKGVSRIPDVHNAIGQIMHQYGIDVGVRQAMRFPSEFKATGFKDPGTAMRKSKEYAQDRVATQVREVNVRTNRQEFDSSMRSGLNETNPSTSRAMVWMEARIDQFAQVAETRLKWRVKQASYAAAAGPVIATIAGGPVAGITVAALYANRDYMAIGAKYALRGLRKNSARNARMQRRNAYDAAVSVGDEAGAAELLRAYRGADTPERTIEAATTRIRAAADAAKARLREINQRNEVCI